VPLFKDEKYANPTYCPPTQTGNCPSVGNVSVTNETLPGNKTAWLMTYDADGLSPPSTQGVYFRYANAPWGPWDTLDGGAAAQPIYLGCRDGGFGTFIHYSSDSLDGDFCTSAPGRKTAVTTMNNPYYIAGTAGPMVGQETGGHDPQTDRGGTFAPLMIRNLTAVSNCGLSIYYTLSTWNPYTVVKMRSDFDIHGIPSCH
jgi:hypothetical protein